MLTFIALLLLPMASATVHGVWQDRDDYQQLLTSTVHVMNPTHQVVFAIKQLNLEKLATLTTEISSPDHESYGQHLTHDQVHAMTANPKAAAAVVEWSQQYPTVTLLSTSSHREYLTFEAPISIWNSLFNSTLIEMQHIESGESIIRSATFDMPKILEEHVAHVFNFVELPLRKGPGVPIRKMTALEIKNDVLELTSDNVAVNAAPYPWPCKSTMKLGCWNYRYNQTTNDATGETQMVFGQKGAFMAPDDIKIWAGKFSITKERRCEQM